MRNMIMAALIFTAVGCAGKSESSSVDSTATTTETTTPVRIDTTAAPDSQTVAVPSTDSVDK